MENSENEDYNNDIYPYIIFNNKENYFNEANNLLFQNHNNLFNDLNLTRNDNFRNYNNNNNSITIEKDYSKNKMKNENNNINNHKDIFIINSIKNLKKDNNENKKVILLKKIEESNQTKTPKPSKKHISNLNFPLKIINLDEKNKSISYGEKNTFELKLREKIKQSQINNSNINKIINIQSNKFLKEKKENNNLKKNNINLGNNKEQELAKFNKIEINFDDEAIIQKKENEKLVNSIEKIKEFLPKDEKTVFIERMEKLGFTKDKKINKKIRNSTNNIRNIKKYQINSINKSSDFNK